MVKSFIALLIFIVNISMYAEVFYFAQVTDVHLGAEVNFLEKDKKLSQYRLDALVESINSINIPLEFVVFTGNITFNGVKYEDLFVKSGIEKIKKINKKMYFLPGNHDIFPASYATRFNMESFIQRFGEISFAEETAGVKLVFFYGENLRIPSVIDGYEPLKWLEKRFDEAEGKPIILFTHSVPGEEFAEEKFRQIWNAENSEKFKKIINLYNIKAIIAGHENADKMRWIGKTPVFIAPNFSIFGGRQASYRVYKYSDGEISYFTKYIEE